MSGENFRHDSYPRGDARYQGNSGRYGRDGEPLKQVNSEEHRVQQQIETARQELLLLEEKMKAQNSKSTESASSQGFHRSAAYDDESRGGDRGGWGNRGREDSAADRGPYFNRPEDSRLRGERDSRPLFRDHDYDSRGGFGGGSGRAPYRDGRFGGDEGRGGFDRRGSGGQDAHSDDRYGDRRERGASFSDSSRAVGPPTLAPRSNESKPRADEPSWQRVRLPEPTKEDESKAKAVEEKSRPAPTKVLTKPTSSTDAKSEVIHARPSSNSDPSRTFASLLRDSNGNKDTSPSKGPSAPQDTTDHDDAQGLESEIRHRLRVEENEGRRENKKSGILFDPKSSQFVESSKAEGTKPKSTSRKNEDSHDATIRRDRSGSESVSERVAQEKAENEGKWARLSLFGKKNEAPNSAVDVSKSESVHHDGLSEKERIQKARQAEREREEQERQHQFEERKKLRTAERLARGPRTKGKLYRYNAKGEIEAVGDNVVIHDAEKVEQKHDVEKEIKVSDEVNSNTDAAPTVPEPENSTKPESKEEVPLVEKTEPAVAKPPAWQAPKATLELIGAIPPAIVQTQTAQPSSIGEVDHKRPTESTEASIGRETADNTATAAAEGAVTSVPTLVSVSARNEGEVADSSSSAGVLPQTYQQSPSSSVLYNTTSPLQPAITHPMSSIAVTSQQQHVLHHQQPLHQQQSLQQQQFSMPPSLQQAASHFFQQQQQLPQTPSQQLPASSQHIFVSSQQQSMGNMSTHITSPVVSGMPFVSDKNIVGNGMGHQPQQQQQLLQPKYDTFQTPSGTDIYGMDARYRSPQQQQQQQQQHVGGWNAGAWAAMDTTGNNNGSNGFQQVMQSRDMLLNANTVGPHYGVSSGIDQQQQHQQLHQAQMGYASQMGMQQQFGLTSYANQHMMGDSRTNWYVY